MSPLGYGSCDRPVPGPRQAMNLLYDLRDPSLATPEKLHMSPLSAWVCRHGSGSLTKLMQLKVSDFKAPLVFEGELPMRRFVAYIDPEDQFSITDKLSQVSNRGGRGGGSLAGNGSRFQYRQLIDS